MAVVLHAVEAQKEGGDASPWHGQRSAQNKQIPNIFSCLYSRKKRRAVKQESVASLTSGSQQMPHGAQHSLESRPGGEYI